MTRLRRLAGRIFPAGPDRIPSLVFAAYVAVAGPVILFVVGSYHWFFRDDWVFLAERDGRWPDLVSPYGGAHWVAVPRLAYLVMWQVAGLRSYVPYQAMVVALHLACAVMLRAIMRRAGVAGWLATAAASVLVIFGPGSENIVWAFQISMVGSLAYGLAHLLLSDHEGGFDRRDAIGIGFGALALMSSGVGISMVGAVGLSVLLRRGWRMAALHVAPLAVLFVGWALVAHPSSGTIFGRPTLGQLVHWVRTTQVATFEAIGHVPALGAVWALVLVVGLVLAIGPGRIGSLADTRRRLATPVALFAASVVFETSSGIGRWFNGDEAARSSRYLHIGAALTLPLLAVAAQAIATRWRPMLPVLAVLFAVAIPFNWSGFGGYPFGPGYMRERERILTNAVRMPFAYDVPDDVQPVPDPFSSDAVNMGFLLSAKRSGALAPSTAPLTPRLQNEFRVRLGVAQRITDDFPLSCKTITGQIRLTPEEGERYLIGDPVAIATRDGQRQTGPGVAFNPAVNGRSFTIELPDLQLIVKALGPKGTFQLCEG